MQTLPVAENEPEMKLTPPAVLSIAGLDPSSGAGFTADLKVFAAHGLYGLACPTAWTVQSTQGVRHSEPAPSTLITEILSCLAEDMTISGVKIGMLGSRENVQAVAGWLGGLRAQGRELPVVLDPVLRASSGAMLLAPEALEVLIRDLLPLVTAVTPNLVEAAVLAELPYSAEHPSRSDAEAAAFALHARLSGNGSVVVTGGHFEDEQTPDDYLLGPGERTGRWIAGERVRTRATHGTGCAFSSALLCALVAGQPTEAAVRHAKGYLQAALRAAYPIGQGHGPMHHLFPLENPLKP